MPNAVMIFAAGFGTRMGALTAERPKPLIEVAGKPLLEHALEQTGARRCVVNAHYKAAQIVDYLAGRDISVSVETPTVLDTGGGLKKALPLLLDDTVFTLNSDAVWHGPKALNILQAAWDPKSMDALLLCVPLPRAIGRQGGGDFSFDVDNRLIRGGDMVYTGAQIVKTGRLDTIGDTIFSLNRLWNLMAKEKRLFGCVYPGHWCDVGHPEGIRLAEKMVRDAV